MFRFLFRTCLYRVSKGNNTMARTERLTTFSLGQSAELPRREQQPSVTSVLHSFLQ